MRCFKCGGDYLAKHGDLRLYNKSIGWYEVQNVDYLYCNKCRRKLFPTTTVVAIERARDSVLGDSLMREPISNFITSAEVAQLLGISRQALSKHRRIRRGFIYWVDVCGIRLYHRESAERFKKNGDGRFKLSINRQELTETLLSTKQALEDIHDIAIGYDGYKTAKGLKKLIDELKDIASEGLRGKYHLKVFADYPKLLEAFRKETVRSK